MEMEVGHGDCRSAIVVASMRTHRRRSLDEKQMDGCDHPLTNLTFPADHHPFFNLTSYSLLCSSSLLLRTPPLVAVHFNSQFLSKISNLPISNLCSLHSTPNGRGGYSRVLACLFACLVVEILVVEILGF
ncbi:hypothetical protein Droror1_Dr00008262 [Drosera rotundifolia]